MGIKKMFKKKEPTEEEIREDLNRMGISTRSNNQRPDQFSAFRTYAQERKAAKPAMAPVNPYANANVNGDGNPYANGGESEEGNPYGANEGNLYGANENNPYGGSSNPYGGSSNPYGGSSNPYGGSQRNTNGGSQRNANGANGNPYGGRSQDKPASNPYGQPRSSAYGQNGATQSSAASARSNPYAAPSIRTSNSTAPPSYSSRISRQSTRTTMDTNDTESLDLNEVPTNQPPVKPRAVRKPRYDDESTLDLNEVEDEEDLNIELDDELPEEEEVNSEDEEVEGIKQDIKYYKQESLASTRNTLRMAQEADASGTNTLGMLGSQSERLYNAEQNLLLSDTQSKIADEKVKELERYNRTIFLPATSINPFNKKSRLRQQEAKIKANKTQEKYMREANRKGVYESEQRLKEGITNSATNSELHAKYQGEKSLKEAQRYQFENDLEDDEMEKELASNLDQIAAYSKKLKNSAGVMGQEVDTQNTRLRKIEDDADRLDINVHLNNTRLNRIR